MNEQTALGLGRELSWGCQDEGPSLISSVCVRNLGGFHTCIPSVGEVETGTSLWLSVQLA